MTKVRADFRRMLLTLPHNRRDDAAVGLIAEFAGLFDVVLVGTYVDDVNLCRLPEIPNVREFRAGRRNPSAPNSWRATSLSPHGKPNACSWKVPAPIVRGYLSARDRGRTCERPVPKTS